MKSGQGAFEYILIVAIAMVLIVPGVILFYNYSLKSNDQVLRSQIEMIGNDLMDAAEKVYYIGEYSWQSVRINIPEKVSSACRKIFCIVFSVWSTDVVPASFRLEKSPSASLTKRIGCILQSLEYE